MTIKKPELRIINSKKGNKEHNSETMAHLKKLLEDNNFPQLKLAHELGKDKTTVNRWVKNSRKIDWQNAEEIAKVLGCHPVEIYQPAVNVILKHNCSWDGLLKDIPKEEQIKIKVPFEWYNDQVKAVQMDAPGTPNDGEIW